MKKIIAILVIFLCAGAALSAQMQMSVGAGGSFTSAFGGGMKVATSMASGTMEFPYSGGGIHAFFDATYVEASVGLFYGSMNQVNTVNSSSSSTKAMDFEGITLGLLGKYPIALGFMTLFPAVGIECLLITKGTNGNYIITDPDKFNHLWIKFGVGADFSIAKQIYIRGTVLYGIRFESKFESDFRDNYNNYGYYDNVDPLLGHGIQIKFAVGYRL
ncbi:MAG: hypothetical protein FWC12_12865 [Treponema sp.]|nr:hypothetical protein [Treponema sp.]